MATDQQLGSPGGGTLPSGRLTGSSTGGTNTSDSTVSGGGSSPGSVISGLPRDRGTVPDVDLNRSTNTDNLLDANSRRDALSNTSASSECASPSTPRPVRS
jgi:hypothetical protein